MCFNCRKIWGLLWEVLTFCIRTRSSWQVMYLEALVFTYHKTLRSSELGVSSCLLQAPFLRLRGFMVHVGRKTGVSFGRYGVFSTDVNFLASGLFGRSYLYLLHDIFFLKGILLRKWPKNIIKIRWIIISLQKKTNHSCLYLCVSCLETGRGTIHRINVKFYSVYLVTGLLLKIEKNW